MKKTAFLILSSLSIMTFSPVHAAPKNQQKSDFCASVQAMANSLMETRRQMGLPFDAPLTPKASSDSKKANTATKANDPFSTEMYQRCIKAMAE